MVEFRREAEDVGNIVHLEHVNLTIPAQGLATLFYVVGLRLTRDPYLMVGLDNMWVNIGRSQMHLPHRDAPQIFRGTIGLVVPDLDAIAASLDSVAGALDSTAFEVNRRDDFIEATCPWGNRFRVHAPDPAFGATQLGMTYLEMAVASGAAAGIAAFYDTIIGAPSAVVDRRGTPTASVSAGRDQRLYFMETDAALAPYDGHHYQIYIADFSGPYHRLRERDLITLETDAHEWRFCDIVDPADTKLLFKIEHEVRSLKHPLYARPLINRNPAQRNIGYTSGHDAFRGTF